MKATITIEVSDDFLTARCADVYAGIDEQGPRQPPPADVFLRETLEGIAGDELRIALWGWPIESTAVEVLAE